MSKTISLLLTVHFHQPVGNFDSVIEKACKRCYVPFLDLIEKFPQIKFNIHYSGCLLEWMKKHRPDIMAKIKKLVQSNQIELLGGGFYEPILPILPEQDAIEQIRSFSEFIEKEFKTKVRGAWLAERVWEPFLAKIFNEAGISYTVVDDTHLRYAGFSKKALYGYYLTEHEGDCVAVFPSSKFLRYSIPFKEQQDSINYIRSVKDECNADCVLYGDDGEKFGEWPGTYDWVYNKKWLYNFLVKLKENIDWIKPMRISDYMDVHSPTGRIYLPTSSYNEMSEWALPSETAEDFEDLLERLKREHRFEEFETFLRGGFWRNFLVKYPESNQIHKRMLLVSKRLRALEVGLSPDKKRSLNLAKKELFKAQCNCTYWHGVFGGLYLYHLRLAVYKHMIQADRMLDTLEYKDKKWIGLVKKDFDCDGAEELIVNTPKSVFIIDPAEGGALIEWDSKTKYLNLINTLSRKKEAYHRKLDKHGDKAVSTELSTIHADRFSKTGITLKSMSYDVLRRSSFIEHFVGNDVNIENIANNSFKEHGAFAGLRYKVLKNDFAKSHAVKVGRDGIVDLNKVFLTKAFLFSPSKEEFSVKYEISNLGSDCLSVGFAPEMNFSLTKDAINEELKACSGLSLKDPVHNFNIELSFSSKASAVYRYCVCTVSQSERDIEENYQATCVFPVFKINLEPSSVYVLSIVIKLKCSPAL
ncbi:MAG: alpha-amylase/4-alpha-glucanotransferase domain-containing protein [Candidatus Omnitrophota bacterium]